MNSRVLFSTASTALALVALVSGLAGTARAQVPGGSAAESPRETAPVAGENWLETYLAQQLHYDEQQIEQFKANVAEMPPEQLRSLLEQLRQRRQVGPQWREQSFYSHQRNLQRLEVARASARAHPSVPSRYQHMAGYDFGGVPRRVHAHDPARVGLFRGYSVWILGR